ncbi:hypothetical protein [Hymenobacter chitinivorans]|uniref:Uncharacterized protein n=1 Tax=Hymenobacter chitinivorans DSM 11115 TaxID=1121954 RepID=A0A2M9BS52_9BACT|nr:hypothetical protein [Hymenobacter chitinivorans]PJJ60784.1 hypothetical protein CLV45_2217 [Hymenobacter chitinivorans DSM 11115]
MRNTDGLKNRKELKDYFKRGAMPTEESFANLIESVVNRRDDGFEKSPEAGLMLAATDEFRRLLAFYKDMRKLQEDAPAWLLELLQNESEGQAAGLSFSELQTGTAALEDPAAYDCGCDDEVGPGTATGPKTVSRLVLQPGGNVGIGTTRPTERLDVNGFVASRGRIGTYPGAQPGNAAIPADRQWYPIISGLDGLHAFEIVAAAYGPLGKGRYALTHATALSAFGKSRSRIYRQNAWFRGWFQKIQFRWTGELHNYSLEMRSASNYGPQGQIVYSITHLFDDRRPLVP